MSVLSAGALLFGFGSTVDAAPPTFAAGEPLSASKMNASFAAVDGRVAKLEARFGTDRQYGHDAVYVKSTVPTPGDLAGLGVERGYGGARKACQTKTASPTAHVCSTEEILRSLSLGIAVPEGRFAAAVFTDCQGFSTTSTSFSSAYLAVSPSTPSYVATTACASPMPLLCCDAAP